MDLVNLVNLVDVVVLANIADLVGSVDDNMLRVRLHGRAKVTQAKIGKHPLYAGMTYVVIELRVRIQLHDLKCDQTNTPTYPGA